MRHTILVPAVLALVWPGVLRAQSGGADSYTRYELLAPESASFRIVYDVTATTPGARYYFNPIRQGSEASDESVIDRMTGQPLKFEVVTGEAARRDGERGASPDGQYIKVHLARPVPEGGEARIRIIKTYKDEKSYYRQGDLIVFDRSLGIKRNAIVLPAGCEIVSSNFPSQVIEEADGRLAISHWNNTPSAAPVLIRARKLASASPAAAGRPPASPRPPATPTGPARPAAALVAPARPAPLSPAPPADELRGLTVGERAFENREIVYFLKQPETHAFSLYHDYTETRPGVDRYLNVVRAGSAVSDPSAIVLDTGERLSVETLKGEAIARANLGVSDVTPETEVVVIRFPAVKDGQSLRLRISETYTDASRYGIVDDQLVWHRSFGRPSNDVVLPEGWYLTMSAIPGVITTEPDGRTRVSFINPRPDSIDVVLKARRR
jgi:hypothetical protein